MNPAEQQQLTLDAIERSVTRVVQAAFTEPKTLRDPRKKLSSYPQNMRVDQVAAYLNCDEKTVRNLCDTGDLEATNIAINTNTRRTLRINRDSVATFEQKRKAAL